MTDTYRDGVHVERCLGCGSALRSATDDPVVTLRAADVDAIAVLLDDVAQLLATHREHVATMAEMLDMLSHVCGRSVRQIRETLADPPAVDTKVAKIRRGQNPAKPTTPTGPATAGTRGDGTMIKGKGSAD